MQKERQKKGGKKKTETKPSRVFPAETTETPVDQKEHRLAQRNKQIQIGKSTVGYNRYLAEVPIENRVRGEERHPMTPNPKQDCSKRSWDGQVKVWRRRLHFWTPKDEEDKKEQVEDDFYEKAEEDKQPSASASRPLPEVSMFVCRVNISDLLRKVVPMDKVEPMQLNGENSLLGQWTANSQSSAPMDLQVCGN